MKEILDAILDPASQPADFAVLPLPEAYRAVTLHRDEEHMFDGVDTRDRDPRKSLHLEEVPVPELGLGEALIAVMASAVNYNTVWSSIFSPVSTFAFLRRYGKLSELTARHDLPYHVVGSDLAGVVLRTGPGVTVWKPGEEVVAHCLSVELESSDGHNDTMLDPEQRIWGYETNFGGLAELALVKTNQLMPKPKHLTWEEAATPGLVNSTAFRQLVSDNGAVDEAGPQRPDLGGQRRPGRLCHPVRAGRRGDPGLRGLQRAQGRAVPGDGRRADHQPRRRGLPVLEGRADPGPQGVEAVRRQDPRADRRRGRRHRLRAPGPGDVRRLGVRDPPRRHDRDLRLDHGVHARVRQPLPVDEPQADHRLALRQLPGGVAGQPPDLPRA